MNAMDIVENAEMVPIQVATAEFALSVLEHRDDVQILFSDIDLPGAMNGMDLALAVRERWPSIGLILTSGHMLSRSFLVPEGGVFLPKPYSAQEVVRALQSMAIDRAPSTDRRPSDGVPEVDGSLDRRAG